MPGSASIFGPTLLSWLEEKAPRVYQAILDADKMSQKLFSGHGAAIAQAENHMIMPLANRRDKETQIVWGDFVTSNAVWPAEPEGMWLAETAVDLETLDILSQYGIRFTILSPKQARQERDIGAKSWRSVDDGSIDPSLASAVHLPSQRTLSVFADGPIFHAVAFEGLLKRGEILANRLAQAFSSDREWPQLAHIADGRRDVRPPPLPRRYGPCLRARAHRGGELASYASVPESI